MRKGYVKIRAMSKAYINKYRNGMHYNEIISIVYNSEYIILQVRIYGSLFQTIAIAYVHTYVLILLKFRIFYTEELEAPAVDNV